MTDQTIRPGDMVMVVRGCCDKYCGSVVGIPFVVDRIISTDGDAYCQVCGHCIPAGWPFVSAPSPIKKEGEFVWQHVPAAWVQKINGPSVKEGDKTEQPVREVV